MKKLSKTQIDMRNALAIELDAKFDAVREAIEDLNKTIASANEFVEEVHSAQDDYFSERSEAWQEGDAGSAYTDWMSEWEFSLEELSDPTDDVDLDAFESLQESPS